MNIINTIVGVPLGYLMWFCYKLVSNYGVAIILFTVLTKIILLPINLWVQKNSIKMVKLQPQVNTIMAKYSNQKDLAAEKQLALYKKEGYRPMVGIVPMLLQIPIILGLIAVIYNPIQHLLHISPDVINQLGQILNIQNVDSSFQINIIEAIQSGSLPTSGLSSELVEAKNLIMNMNLNFLGLNLAHNPSFKSFDIYWIIPALSGLSSFVMSAVQNKENVLQKEQGFLGKWGVAIFLIAFSTYFAFIVASGVGLYWTASNLLAIGVVYLLNAVYNPKKHIDYKALEESKRLLDLSKDIQEQNKPTRQQKARGRADYKRFNDEKNVKHLVYYSEKSGYFKYFEAQINFILKKSDIDIHYLTSDPNDVVFDLDESRIIPYYVPDGNRLATLFMMMDADVMVCTTMNLQTYHLKRSLLYKELEYIYAPHDPVSIHMASAKGSVDHYDTVLCVGQYQIDEIRATEEVYGLKEKNLVACGYPLIDELIELYEKTEKKDQEKHGKEKILIAPSWQEDNILDSCIDDLLTSLLDKGYDITVRPHPEYVKRYNLRLQQIIEKYEHRFSDDFRIETDFSSNVSIFTADIVVTDWSGIAFEFSYATKKPTLFINTKIKIMNPEYDKIQLEPMEVTLRNRIGMSIEKQDVINSDEIVSKLLNEKDQWEQRIEDVMENYLFNIGNSAEVGADYIIKAVERKADRPRLYSN